MARILLKRGTRAQLDAAASGSALAAGEPYLISDEGRMAIASGPSAYQAAAMRGTAEAFSMVDLPAGGNQAAPAAGNIRLYGRSLAGRCMPEWVGGCGLNTAAQPLLAQNKVAFWAPPGNSTVFPGVFGMLSPTWATGSGSPDQCDVNTNSILTRMKRLAFRSASATGAVTSWRIAALQYALGNGAGLGGFTFITRWGVSDLAVTAGARMFIGMRNSTAAPTNVEPSTITNCIGVAQLSTSANLHLVYGGSAAQTPIDLGPNFPAGTLNTDAYEIALFAAPNIANSIGYRVSRLGTPYVAEGTLTSATPGLQLPSSTTLLTPNFYRTNNVLDYGVRMDICSVYVETDY